MKCASRDSRSSLATATAPLTAEMRRAVESEAERASAITLEMLAALREKRETDMGQAF